MDSILTSIKKMLGITEEYTHFDQDLIMHINSVFTILMQLGVGPENGFFIGDKFATWNDYMEDSAKLQFVKTYIYLKVKMMFDPPISSAVSESTKRLIDELEWRITVSTDAQ